MIPGDEYNYAGGCGVLHPFNAKKRAECEKNKGASAKQTQAEADKLLAQAALAKATQAPPVDQWTPMATIGLVVGGIVALTVMVVIIKKVKSSKK